MIELAKAKLQLQYVAREKDRLEAAKGQAERALECACATMQVQCTAHVHAVLSAAESYMKHETKGSKRHV